MNQQKDKKPISASEINRFLHCNYQWYYERVYGAAELRRRKKQHLEEHGIKPEKTSPLQRGLVYHAKFGRHHGPKQGLKILLFLAVLGLIFWVLMRFGVIF